MFAFHQIFFGGFPLCGGCLYKFNSYIVAAYTMLTSIFVCIYIYFFKIIYVYHLFFIIKHLSYTIVMHLRPFKWSVHYNMKVETFVSFLFLSTFCWNFKSNESQEIVLFILSKWWWRCWMNIIRHDLDEFSWNRKYTWAVNNQCLNYIFIFVTFPIMKHRFPCKCPHCLQRNRKETTTTLKWNWEFVVCLNATWLKCFAIFAL